MIDASDVHESIRVVLSIAHRPLSIVHCPLSIVEIRASSVYSGTGTHRLNTRIVRQMKISHEQGWIPNAVMLPPYYCQLLVPPPPPFLKRFWVL